MKAYQQLDFSSLAKEGFSLVPLREQDIFSIMDWRNAQMDVLRQKVELTRADQERYYREVVVATFSQPEPSQMLFSFLHDGRCIGYGGITNIDWSSKRVELSFLSDNTRPSFPEVYDREFSCFLTLVKKLVFQQLHFNRIFMETYDIRPLHVMVLERNGFVPEGRMRGHVFIRGRFVDALIHGFNKSQYEEGVVNE